MENNSSLPQNALIKGGMNGTQSSKRSRQNQDYVEPVITARRMTGIIVRSGNTPMNSSSNDKSKNSAMHMAGQLEGTSARYRLGSPGATTTQASEGEEERDQPFHLETLHVPPRKIRKTSSQEQKTLSPTKPSSSQFTSLPSPTRLRQVPVVIDLTLDDANDDTYSPPKPSIVPVMDVASSSTTMQKPRSSPATSLTNQIRKERPKKKSKATVKKNSFNYLGLESSDTDSDDASSSSNKLSKKGRAQTSSGKQWKADISKSMGTNSSSCDEGEEDVPLKRNVQNSTKQQQQHTVNEEDELDDGFDDEDHSLEASTKATLTSGDLRRRVISAPSSDESDVEEHVEHEENEGDEELESIRMKFTGSRYSHDPAGTSEVDELDSVFDGEEEDHLQHVTDEIKEASENQEQRQQVPPKVALPTHVENDNEEEASSLIESSERHPQQAPLEVELPTHVEIEYEKEKSPPIESPEQQQTIDNEREYPQNIVPFFDDSNSPSPPPASIQNKQVEALVNKENDTNTSINTVSSITSTSTLTTCTSMLSSPSDRSFMNGIPMPASLISSPPLHLMDEDGDTSSNHANIDQNNDEEYYSVSQRGQSATSEDDEFITAEPELSSTTDMIDNDTDYKRLPRHKLKTGYVYDVIMTLHAQLDTHDDDPHPEDPRRIFRIYKCMEENGLLSNCIRLPIRQATEKEILTVHDPMYIKSLRQTEDMTRKDLEKEAKQYNSIYMNAHSLESALYSAGGVIEACSAVATDKVQNAFAIVRPPGHHAEFEKAMGFCLMNNVAIAARYCKAHFPYVERILILDWDIHFGNYNWNTKYTHEKTHHNQFGEISGNGTQQLTSRDQDILYMSLHRYEGATFYPQDKHGGSSYMGRGTGKGRTVNIPWPTSGMTDGDYLYAFRQIVMPIAMEFAPSLVIVSAGFDAADGDTIGECHVTPAGYGQMTHMLKSLANGRIVLALEGGYNLDSIAKSAHACMSVLMGEAPEIPAILTPSPGCVETIQKVKKIQSEYWDSLKY